jgi:hypothetical protein
MLRLAVSSKAVSFAARGSLWASVKGRSFSSKNAGDNQGQKNFQLSNAADIEKFQRESTESLKEAGLAQFDKEMDDYVQQQRDLRKKLEKEGKIDEIKKLNEELFQALTKDVEDAEKTKGNLDLTEEEEKDYDEQIEEVEGDEDVEEGDEKEEAKGREILSHAKAEELGGFAVAKAGGKPLPFKGVVSPTPGLPTSFIDKFFYWFRFPIMAPGDPYPDPWTINYFVRCDEIMEELRVDEEDREKFLEQNDMSQGYATLEWCLPSPPPHHTFEESPFMKEASSEEEELAEAERDHLQHTGNTSSSSSSSSSHEAKH